ncbi:MAG: hypothetical protein COA62_15505 [Rhodobiaceae bacterium]|nr:MAG: hypothetical protein COA62_15505 [Rhodobiaceae bacterium]
MDIKKAVGLRIKEFREAESLTQADLADLTGRSVDTISHLERGVSLPNFRTLELLGEKLDVPMRDFFPGSNKELKNPKRAALAAKLTQLGTSLSLRDLETAVELVKTLEKRAASGRK